MAWTDKMVEDLKIMWKQGLTTGEIGKRLGVSKNSIVGKVHRLQLDARPSPIKKKDEVSEEKAQTQTAAPNTEKAPAKAKEDNKNAVKSKPAVKTAVSAEKEEKAEPAPAKTIKEPEKTFVSKPAAPAKTYNGNAKLTDLDNHTRRWPIGDPKDENFHFCGRKIRMGQTYCEEHAALAYVKPAGKK